MRLALWEKAQRDSFVTFACSVFALLYIFPSDKNSNLLT